MTDTASQVAANSLLPSFAIRWRHLSLAMQFALAGSVVLLAGMIAIGVWVTRQIEDEVTRNTAASTALYMDSFVEPLLQELADGNTISLRAEQELDKLLKSTSLGREIVSFKVWKEGGLIVYSSHKSIVGQSFPTTPNLNRAWTGEVTAEFDTLDDEEDAMERVGGLPLVGGPPLLEIYSPIRESRTGRIIAVAEFNETAEVLKANLFAAVLTSWLVVGAVTASMLGLLSGIVLRGSRIIDSQRHALENRVAELSQLLAQNEKLHERVQRASRRTSEINEQYLRRIGSDLHDGPAQLLALAALRLDSLKSTILEMPEKVDRRSDLDVVQESLADALVDIRDICTGLTLPDLDDLSPANLLTKAAKEHERRTKTVVKVDIQSAPDAIEKSMKICLYRFVQEVLSNAYRHAGGAGQRLTCRYDGGVFEVEASDTGPGFVSSDKAPTTHGLGLPGLEERIESLGGTLQIISAPGEGARLILSCPVTV